MAALREIEGSRTFPLPGKVTLIGRDPACDLAVGSLRTSGRHALILKVGGAHYLEDLDSANGTFVNGMRVRQRVRLSPGDQITLPGLAVVFEEEAPGGGAAGGLTAAAPATALPPSVVSTLDTRAGLRVQVRPEIKLQAILQIWQSLGTTLDLKGVLPKILDGLFAIFPQADRGFILLRDPDTGQLVPRAVRDRHAAEGAAPAFSATVVNHALATGRAILSVDAGRDERFGSSESVLRLRLRSIMCVPLLSHDGTALGVIQIDTQDEEKRFRQEDLDVLVSAAAQAARDVVLAQLHEERRDLEAATQIQKSFLPARPPALAGLRFFEYYSPARHVGGDYYDYIPLPGNRLAVALGDVSGKGISAALLMARLSAAVRFCLASNPSVPEAVRQLSATLTREGTEDRFVTFVVAVLDPADFSLTLVNAGHMPPLRRRSGGVDDVGPESGGLPLGVMDRPYAQAVLPFEPGDTLVLYTDGVTEARNPAGKLYGAERLRAVVRGAPDDVEALGRAILDDVRSFAAGRPQNDDLTIVCFSRRP